MKTRSIARGIVGSVAALLGVMAAGCSAETGSPDEAAEIGSTSQALTSLGAGLGRTFAGSCVLHDATSSPARDLLVVAGGFDSSGNALSDVLVYDGHADNWTASVTGSLGTARGALKGIQDPNHSDTCYFIGGTSSLGGAAIAYSAGTSWNVDKVVLSGARAVTVSKTNTAAANLLNARGRLQVSQCGSKIIAVGGDSSGTAKNQIEYFDTNAGTPTWTSLGTLTTARYDFALAADPNHSFDRFVVAGGQSGGQLTSIEVVTTSDSCTSMTKTQFDTTSGGIQKKLTVAKDQLVGFPSSTTDHFIMAAGDNSGTAKKTVDDISVTAWSPAAISVTSPSDITAATINPMLANKAGTWYILGGKATSTTTFSTNAIQPYLGTAVNLASGRFAGVAEYLPSEGTGYVATGRSVNGTPDYLLTVESF